MRRIFNGLKDMPEVLDKTIEILEHHQKWRRDKNVPPKVPQRDPIELGAALDYAIEELKILRISNVVHCNFKTVVREYDDTVLDLATSDQVLPFHKGDRMTIKDRYYEVQYVDYDFDREIFEVVVTDET